MRWLVHVLPSHGVVMHNIHIQVARSLHLLATCAPIAPASAAAPRSHPLLVWDISISETEEEEGHNQSIQHKKFCTAKRQNKGLSFEGKQYEFCCCVFCRALIGGSKSIGIYNSVLCRWVLSPLLEVLLY